MAGDGRRLAVLVDGRFAGWAQADAAGRFSITYDDEWQHGISPAPTPVSLSMPVARAHHADAAVRPFLWGLLPDNQQVIDRWARTYQVSSRNPFALLRHVGEDCAGGVQFVAPERIDAVLAGVGEVEWLDEDGVAARLRVLEQDPAAWHVYNSGQFSLAGAQAKTALYRDPVSQRWGVPAGAIPTTHILKPAMSGLTDHDLNEHLCLTVASRLGITAATSTVESFGAERAIVVQRYDRTASGGVVQRVHQEDMCQALAVMPTAKYQADGGPSPEQVIELLRAHVAPAATTQGTVDRFVDSLALNWLIAGTDAHGKNYSVLLRGRQVRLCPLYDVASVLPYDDFYLPKLKMAMKIGGEYRLMALSARHWRKFAEANALDPDALLSRIDELAARLVDLFEGAAADEAIRGLGSPLPARLIERLVPWVDQCRRSLTY